MNWIYEKFIGDMAIYAFCPICGFHHNPSSLDSATNETKFKYQYNYCPMCGEHLYDGNEEISVIWNLRHIKDKSNPLKCCKDCVNYGWDMPECSVCKDNDLKYFKSKQE
jgi:hypothetical protein